MSLSAALLIFFGGMFAGIVNAMAGGGSLLTVPLLSLGGVEGLLANGTNRVAVLIQTGAVANTFRKRKVPGWHETIPLLAPMLAGGIVGALVVSRIDDQLFERIFGVLMIPMLVLALWKPRAGRTPRSWPRAAIVITFFGVGLYAGAIQAGVGLILMMVLSRAGHDLVTANVIKSHLVIAVSLVAVTVFIVQGQVQWIPALVLSAGAAIGGYFGAHIAVEGGEKVIRPVLAAAVFALAGRMVGLY